MSELQLIAITHKEYQHYKKQDETICKLNLQINDLKKQLQLISILSNRNKQLIQENGEFKAKIKLLSRESIRLARAIMEKEESIQEANQRLDKIRLQRDQVLCSRQSQSNKIALQWTNQKLLLQQELQKASQKYNLVEGEMKKVLINRTILQQQVQSIKEINKQYQSQLNKLEEALKTKQQEKALLVEKIEEKNTQNLLISKQLQLAEAKIRNQSQNINQIQTQMTKLSEKVREMDIRQVQFKCEIENYQILYNNLLQKEQKLKTESISMEAQLKKMSCQITQLVQTNKKLQGDCTALKPIYEELQCCQGELLIYRTQIQKKDQELKIAQLKIQELVQARQILANQVSAWKLMISEQFGERWKDILHSKYFAAELKDKKKAIEFCKDLLCKYINSLKFQIWNNFDQEEGEIILKMEIQNLANDFEKELSYEKFKQLL